MSIFLRALVLFRTALYHRLFWYVLAWILAINASILSLYCGWIAFRDDGRPNGNSGHMQIDFGGQYLMGRMLVTGNGRELYNRYVQVVVLSESYPIDQQNPQQKASDAQQLMGWVMGMENDDANVPTAFAVSLTPLAANNPLSVVILEAEREASSLPAVVRGGLAPLASSDVLTFVNLESARRQFQSIDDGKERLWPDLRVAELGGKRSVGGPLYPPINAFFYAPLAFMDPQTAYRVNQILNVLLIFVSALGISLITRGGVWCPVAVVILCIFPGCAGSINLGQNAVHTLAIAVWGWVLASRGRPGWAGVVWGLLAFKPVWALALFIVPLLSGRWKMCLTMILTGTLIALATLPFVGVHSWLNWLQVGRSAAKLYNTDENWIHLSRDLLGLPRRFLLQFGSAQVREPIYYPPPPWGAGNLWHGIFGGNNLPGWLVPSLFGWILVAIVLEVTVRVALMRRQEVKAIAGPPAAFLFLGSWMLCYHFMYYDMLLAALPVLLLWHNAAEYLKPVYLVLWVQPGSLAGQDFGGYYSPQIMQAMPPQPPALPLQYRHVWLLNRMIPNLTVALLFSQYLLPMLWLDSFYRSPRDTLWIMVIWLWTLVVWMQMANSSLSRSR